MRKFRTAITALLIALGMLISPHSALAATNAWNDAVNDSDYSFTDITAYGATLDANNVFVVVTLQSWNSMLPTAYLSADIDTNGDGTADFELSMINNHALVYIHSSIDSICEGGLSLQPELRAIVMSAPRSCFGNPTSVSVNVWVSLSSYLPGTAWDFAPDFGFSPATSLSVPAPVPAPAPAPTKSNVPRSVTGNFASTRAAIRWAAPVPIARHPITGFVVHMAGHPSRTLAVTSRSWTFSGLTNGVGYRLYVQAKTSLGLSAPVAVYVIPR